MFRTWCELEGEPSRALYTVILPITGAGEREPHPELTSKEGNGNHAHSISFSSLYGSLYTHFPQLAHISFPSSTWKVITLFMNSSPNAFYVLTRHMHIRAAVCLSLATLLKQNANLNEKKKNASECMQTVWKCIFWYPNVNRPLIYVKS